MSLDILMPKFELVLLDIAVAVANQSFKIITNPYGGGARGVVVIAVGNERGDMSSNPGRDRLLFTLH